MYILIVTNLLSGWFFYIYSYVKVQPLPRSSPIRRNLYYLRVFLHKFQFVCLYIWKVYFKGFYRYISPKYFAPSPQLLPALGIIYIFFSIYITLAQFRTSFSFFGQQILNYLHSKGGYAVHLDKLNFLLPNSVRFVLSLIKIEPQVLKKAI